MSLADEVRDLVAEAGFPYVRFAAAEPMLEARQTARAALEEGHLADLAWMTAEWFDRATDPGRFLAGARSVVMVALPYARTNVSERGEGGAAQGRIAAYAAGRDYHRVFESKLRRLARELRERFDCQARPTVDYGPLLERPLAARAGMGWQGRSTMLLVPGAGPYVLLGAIATTLSLAPDAPLRKSCGSCTRCVGACPTGALSDDGRLDARLCISYHTIENRGPIPRELRSQFGNWVFGCDACLDACPPGFRHTGGAPELAPREGEGHLLALREILGMDEAAFRERFQGRAIMRAKRDGLVRNACVALGNVGSPADLTTLTTALTDTAALVRGHAAWAIGRLVERHPPAATGPIAADALRDRLASEDDEWVREELTLALQAVTEAT